jgi:hypothetical protein
MVGGVRGGFKVVENVEGGSLMCRLHKGKPQFYKNNLVFIFFGKLFL